MNSAWSEFEDELGWYPKPEGWRAWQERQSLRDSCPHSHTEKISGRWWRGDNEKLHLLTARNGTVIKHLVCEFCGRTTSALPHAQLLEWGLTDEAATAVRVNEPATYPPCSYRDCPEPGKEQHHFAPWNTFGADAANWPTADLCRHHHQTWHRTMDGYRWHKRGIWRDSA